MKKFWKIFGITLGSILGVVLVAILIAIYFVFTPARLTPIVRNVAAQYISTDHYIGDVDLTFFSTFPEFGLHINGLYIVNPMENAQSDTLLAAPDVVAKVDVKRFLKEKALDVHELTIKGINANIFFNEQGESNLNVFVLPQDTTKEDTTAFSLPFDQLNVEKVNIVANSITYLDLKSKIDAKVENIAVDASAKGLEDIQLHLLANDVSAAIDNEIYADHLKLNLKSEHTALRLDTLSVALKKAEIAVNEFALTIAGEASLPGDDIAVDAAVSLSNWDVVQLLKLLPANITKMLDGIDIDKATVSLDATAKGIYNDSVMPLVDASLKLSDAQAAYMDVFPYKIEDINLTADAHIDLNNKPQSSVKIQRLHARTGKTQIDAAGNVSELLGDLLADINANLKVNLPEFKQYLEADNIQTDLKGTAQGKAHAKIRLSDLTNMTLSKGDISADLDIRDLAVQYDSILLNSDKMNVKVQIPNRKPSKKSTNWAAISLQPNQLNVEMIDLVKAELGNTDIKLETSDVLSNSAMLYAAATLQSTSLSADMDTINAAIEQPDLTAYVEYNTKKQDAIPLIQTKLLFNDLKANYTDIIAHLKKSEITASISSTKESNQPRLKAMINTVALQASKGDSIKASTQAFRLYAQGYRDPSKENFLLQWSPRLSIDLNEGNVEIPLIQEKIEIPKIRFDYSNRQCDIMDSRIIIGNSDFSLTGKINNIGHWLEKKDILKGTVEFTSEHTDVNELMAILSADTGTDETPEAAKAEAEKSQTQDANPFLVPKDMDITLNTNIKEAVVFDQVARDLGGHLYIKDGVMVLEEMGFVCNAAKLQLTAIYKTPRRNHIFVGLDYHMLDINVQELVNMIPQIDTMMPMLRSFRGDAEFHLAAETFTDAAYRLKTSTTRGALNISGKNLVLLDGETFTQIAKILMFNKKTENKVDSISATATLFKNEIDIYPFCLTMDKYMAAVGGRHNLDMSFNYHVSLLKPLYIGVDVNGTFDDLHIKPAKCRYAQDFRPIIRKDVETQNASLKKMIDAALKRNVRTEE